MSQILQFRQLASYPAITHAISTKAHGTMKKDDGSIHHANLLKFVQKTKIKKQAICMEQVHGGNVAIVENARELVIPKADGLVTKNKELALVVATADCLPVLFYDPEKEVIGVAHAGRKGLANNILSNVVEAFKTNFDSKPETIFVSIGPSIEQSCYEVSAGIVEELQKTFPSYSDISLQRDNKYYLDLRKIAVQSLYKAGILEKHIEVTDMCTKCSPDTLYSYRGGDVNNRFISVIGFTNV